VHVRCASRVIVRFLVKLRDSDTAGAALSAALVLGVGEGGVVWGWWGMGISECTGPSAAFRVASVMSRPSALRVTWLTEEPWKARRPSVVAPRCVGAGG